MTTILIKKKDTAGAPAPGDLTNAAGGAEIAVNTATKRIYSKDSGGTIIEMGTYPSSMAVQGALSATGATNLNGNVTLGDASADNITVTGTITSSLLFTDATYDIGASGANRPRDLFLSRNLTVGGTLVVTGGINFNGNVTVGDSSADTLTINSTITSNLIFTDNTYDIGASGATRPRNLYLSGAINVGSLANAPRYVVSSTSNAGTSDISLGSYSSGAWLNSPTGTTGYLATAGTGVASWNASGVDVPAGTLTVAGSGSRGVRLRGLGSGEVALAGDGTTYATSVAFYNTTSYTSPVTGIFAYASAGVYQYLSLGGSAYNNGAIYMDSNKNVGVFGAPLGAYGNRRSFEVFGNGVAAVNFNGPIAESMYNTYLNSSGQQLYYANGPAAIVNFNNNTTGGFSWLLAASGTAGAAVSSLSNAMALDSTALWVGTTAGAFTATRKLQVANGLTLGYGLYTMGDIGVSSNGSVTITANSYPANVGSNTAVEIKAGTSGGGGPNTLAYFRSDGVTGLSTASPKTWSISPVLQGSYGSVSLGSSLGSSYAGNAYYSSGWKYISASTASVYIQDSNGHHFQVASAGSVDGAISFNTCLEMNTGNSAAAFGGSSLNGGYLRVYYGNNNRPVDIGAGNVRLNAEAGGWGMGLQVFGSSSTYRGYFGFTGSNDSLSSFVVQNENGTGVYMNSGSTAWSSTSDERVKNILGKVENGLAAVMAIDPIYFLYKNDDQTRNRRIGFSAQNVQPNMPEAVAEVVLDPENNPDVTNLSLAPTEMLPYIVVAIKELKSQIDALKAIIH